MAASRHEAVQCARQYPVVYVVGDRFKSFCQKDDLLTYSQLATGLKEGRIVAKKYYIGQGLNQDQISHLRRLLRRQEQEYQLDEVVSIKIKPEYVHKHDSRNVLISYPDRVDEHRFVIDLAIDENCSEMQDHTTGKHIPGLLLVEAARQFYMASFEALALQKYELDSSMPLGNAYILKQLQVNYLNFLFPLRVEGVLNFSHLDWNLEKRTAVGTANILFSQNGKVACQVECTACAFTRPFIDALEKRQFESTYQKVKKEEEALIEFKMRPEGLCQRG